MIKEQAVKAGKAELPESTNRKNLLKEHIALFVILMAAFLSRIYHLTYQSLWSDELYSMVNSNPALSLKEILTELKTNDFHPPLSYLIPHYLFRIIPYSDFTGRLISAVVGTLGIWSMYFLGREIQNKKVGLVMALLTSVNYLHLSYSQEIRMYIWLFLFTVLSTTFFLRSLKSSRFSDYAGYVLTTAAAMYSHYFGVFVFGAEVLCFLHLIIRKLEPGSIQKGFLAGFAVILLFLPWTPNLLVSGSRKHWMGLPGPNYLLNYLYNTLGKDPVGITFYLIGIFVFFWLLWKISSKEKLTRQAAYLLIGYGLLSVYIIAYLVSFFKPILQLKCTIAALPFLIAAVAVGLDTLKQKNFNFLAVALLTLSGCINIPFIRKHYTKITKENYRAIAATVTKNHPTTPIISHYAVYYNYYLNQLHARTQAVNTLGQNPENLIGKPEKLILLEAHGGQELMSYDLIQDKDLNNYLHQYYTLEKTFAVKESSEKALVYTRKH